LVQLEAERFENLMGNLTSEVLRACFSEKTLNVDWSAIRKALDLPSSDESVDYETLRAVQKTDNDARALLDFFFPFKRRISYQVIVHNRAVSKEKTAVAPNFIHSLDALHMRRFVRDMHRAGYQDLWAVHDSFGCHANYLGEMRSILRNQFSIIHGLTSGSDNVLLKTAERVLNGLPWDKLGALSSQWKSAPPRTPRWKDGIESGLDPLGITKDIIGVTLVENMKNMMGEMTGEDNNSSYFVN